MVNLTPLDFLIPVHATYKSVKVQTNASDYLLQWFYITSLIECLELSTGAFLNITMQDCTRLIKCEQGFIWSEIDALLFLSESELYVIMQLQCG